jgi:hypothetical protein
VNALFISLYLDEDVDVLVARLIRARGFMVTTTRDEHQLHNDDETQLEYALSRQLVLVTHNRIHFEQLAENYFQAQKTHAGIIIATRNPPHEISRRLLILLNHLTADEMTNQIRYI